MVLEEHKYIISKDRKFVGEIKGEMLRSVVYDFFENDDNRPDDILLFYYSGHGVERYAAGINDGGQTALSDMENGSSFNPACDPRSTYSSDALHTTIYCNGLTRGL
jgi:hypothetical protein